MDIHPRIQHRIRQNLLAKELEIQSQKIFAVVKLNSVLRYLRGANIFSEIIDVDDLIGEIEKIRGAFISFGSDAGNPISMRDAISPRIDRIYDKLKRLEREQAAEPVSAPAI